MIRKLSTKRHGMTLVEVMMSMAILALFTLGAAKLVSSIRINVSIAREQSQAVNIARNRLERARSVPFSSLTLMAEPGGTRVNTQGLNDGNGSFRRVTAVTIVTNGLAEITVEVWGLNRQTHEFDGLPQSLSTYVTEMYIKQGMNP